MAKRKSKSKKTNAALMPVDPKYYVYYDDAGCIFLVSNEFTTAFDNFLEINYDEYYTLVSGIEPLSNYRVGYKDSDKISLYSLLNPTISFKNDLLAWVCDSPDSDTRLIVEWNNKIKYWVFNVAEEGRPFVQSYSQVLVFFVTLENDFDFLIRTIKIKPADLLASSVYIPFESKFETNIDKITLITSKVLKSYGLVITHE